MSQESVFERCIYCFANTGGVEPCPRCGYEAGACGTPNWVLRPGAILKGRFVVGKQLDATQDQIKYLGWDLFEQEKMELVEYFPRALVTRDVSAGETVSCIPGHEEELEQGRQAFFEKTKLYYACVCRIEGRDINFFFRNNTCYYARKYREKKKA